MLAAKADIREELDRLAAHTAAARELLAKGGAVGRRLDFLAQELVARGQYALRQIERRKPDGARPRIARRDRAVSRAGPEYRVKKCRVTTISPMKKPRPRAKPAWPARLDADSLFPIRGRQDDLDPDAAADQGARSHLVDLGDDAATAFERSRRHPLHLHQQETVRGACATAAICSNGRRCTAIFTARRASRSKRSWRRAATFSSTSIIKAHSRSSKRPQRDAVTIFILPPSMTELRARLERRAEDPPEIIEKRLNEARNEIRRWTHYDYVLVNDDLQSTFDDHCRDPHRRAPPYRAHPGADRCFRRKTAPRDMNGSLLAPEPCRGPAAPHVISLMSKAFTKEIEAEADFDDEIPVASRWPQELHHAGRSPAAPRRICPVAASRAAENRRNRGLGGGQWRPFGEWRLYLRQAASAGN